MIIGYLSTWNSKCGIAEYTSNLIEQLADQDVIIFGNYGYTGINLQAKVYQGTFGVQWWNEPVEFNTDLILKAIEAHEIDVLHIQYQSSLYEPKGFSKLLDTCPIPIVITVHDPSRNSKIRLKAHKFIVHNMDINYVKAEYVPFPIPNVQPVIGSFGLGRNKADIIKNVCNKLGAKFKYFDARESDRWMSSKELYKWIRSCDIIVLWYNETTFTGNSSTLRTVLSCNRPVVVNDVMWFKNLEHLPVNSGVYKVKSEDELYVKLYNLLNMSYKEGVTVKDLAAHHVSLYERLARGNRSD